MRSCFSALLLILVLEAPAHAQHSLRAPIEDSRKGFDKQYKRIFTAFRKAEEREVRERFSDFAIPSHWFTEVFGKDSGPALAERYSREFEKFVYSTTNLFVNVDYAQMSTIGTYVWKSDSSATSTPRSVQPLPRAQYFRVECGSAGFTGPMDGGSGWEVKDWGSESVWRGSFIYVDGAFRFFGLESYPFWELKDDEPGGFCADSRVQGGQVIHKVKPAYPAEAKRKHIKGWVQLNVTVAKDGSVKQVDMVSGNSLLEEAARKAVLQWHYYPPFRTCSQPVETTFKLYLIFPPR